MQINKEFEQNIHLNKDGPSHYILLRYLNENYNKK